MQLLSGIWKSCNTQYEEKLDKMNTWHCKKCKDINIRYYFIQDRWAKGEVDIQYCPTDEMIADFFTKPLFGPQFFAMRATIMNEAPHV